MNGGRVRYHERCLPCYPSKELDSGWIFQLCSIVQLVICGVRVFIDGVAMLRLWEPSFEKCNPRWKMAIRHKKGVNDMRVRKPMATACLSKSIKRCRRINRWGSVANRSPIPISHHRAENVDKQRPRK